MMGYLDLCPSLIQHRAKLNISIDTVNMSTRVIMHGHSGHVGQRPVATGQVWPACLFAPLPVNYRGPINSSTNSTETGLRGGSKPNCSNNSSNYKYVPIINNYIFLMKATLLLIKLHFII